MHCQDTRPRLVAYYDDELSVSEAVQVREHLASCARCRAREARLARATPGGDLVIPVAIQRRLEARLDVDQILAAAAEPAPAAPSFGVRLHRLLRIQVEIPIGVALVYAVILVFSLSAGTMSWWSAEGPAATAIHTVESSRGVESSRAIPSIRVTPVRLRPPPEFGPPPILGHSIGRGRPAIRTPTLPTPVIPAEQWRPASYTPPPEQDLH